MQRVLFACALLCFGSAALGAPPHKIVANYDVSWRGMKVARMTETFTMQDGRYSIESVSEATGLLARFKPETIRVTSEGKVTAQGLQPSAFSNTRKVDSDRNARADFDWAQHRITLTDRAGTRTLALPAGTQDRLSAMYQFMFLPLKEMAELKFSMTNGSKVDTYAYHLTPGQNVVTPLGTFNTTYAVTAEASASRTEVWVATGPTNFPVKMVITDVDGSKFTQVLTNVQFVP